MPSVEVAITGVSVKLEATEMSLGEMCAQAMRTLNEASALEDGKAKPRASGFTTEIST